MSCSSSDRALGAVGCFAASPPRPRRPHLAREHLSTSIPSRCRMPFALARHLGIGVEPDLELGVRRGQTLADVRGPSMTEVALLAELALALAHHPGAPPGGPRRRSARAEVDLGRRRILPRVTSWPPMKTPLSPRRTRPGCSRGRGGRARGTSPEGSTPVVQRQPTVSGAIHRTCVEVAEAEPQGEGTPRPELLPAPAGPSIATIMRRASLRSDSRELEEARKA